LVPLGSFGLAATGDHPWQDASFFFICCVVVVLMINSERVAQLFSRQYSRKGYTWAALGLLITIGVLPALLFWQAARYFEMSLFLRWQQRKMAAAFVDRESPERRSELRAYGSALYETTIRPGSVTPKKARAGA